MSIPRDFNRQPPPIHPGEMLREEWMVPLGLTTEAFAEALHIPVQDLRDLVEERHDLDAPWPTASKPTSA